MDEYLSLSDYEDEGSAGKGPSVHAGAAGSQQLADAVRAIEEWQMLPIRDGVLSDNNAIMANARALAAVYTYMHAGALVRKHRSTQFYSALCLVY